MSGWPVRRLVALSARAWRERYGGEVADLADELISEGRTSRLRAGLELVEGAAAEHGRVLARSPAAALGSVAALTAGAGIGLAVAQGRQLSGTAVLRDFFGRDTAAAGRDGRGPAGVRQVPDRAGSTGMAGRGDQEQGARVLGGLRRLRDRVGDLALPGPGNSPGRRDPAGALAFSAGLVFFLAGIGLRGWSFAALGRYSTYGIVVSPAQPVVADGPYRWLRHPSYGRVLAGAEETDGMMSVMTLCGPAASRPIPLHWHKKEHDYFYCVRGQMQAWADGESRILNPGDIGTAPPGSVHAYQLLGHYNEFLGPIVPSGWDRFFDFTGSPYPGPAYPQVDPSPPPSTSSARRRRSSR